MSALLVERHGADAEVEAALDRADGYPRIRILIHRRGDRFTLELTARSTREWTPVVDAADALFGTLVEGGYAHRELPAGEGVEHAGHRFLVRVERARPALDAEADALLDGPVTPR